MKPRIFFLMAAALACPLARADAPSSSDEVLQRDKLVALLGEKDRWTRLKGCFEYADSLDASQARAAVHFLEARGNPAEEETLQLLAHRWAELDAAGAAANIKTASPGLRMQLVNAVYPAFAEHDPDAALAAARALPAGYPQNVALDSAFVGLTRLDPKRAWKIMQSLPPDLRRLVPVPILRVWGSLNVADATAAALSLTPDEKPYAVEAVGDGLAGSEVDRQKEWAAGLPEGPMRQRGEVAVTRNLVATNGPAAADYVASLSPDDVRGLDGGFMLLFLASSPWAKADPAAVLKRIAPFQGSTSGSQAIHDLITNWSISDPRAALGSLASLNNPALYEDLKRQIVSSWVQMHPAEALAYVRTLPDPLRATLLAQIAPSVASANPQTALELAQAETDPAKKAEKINQIGSDWVRQDPVAAIAYADKLDSYVARTRYLASVMRSWVTLDAPAAEKWLSGMPDHTMRDNIASEAANPWVSSDAAGAATFLDSMAPGHARKEFIAELARVRAQQNPATAMQWASKLHPAERLEPETSIMIQWSMVDAAAAAKYLSVQSQDPIVNRTLQYVASNWARTNAHAALDWLGTFPDGETRDEAYGQFFDTWTSCDRSTAETWLKGQSAGHLRDIMCRSYSQSLGFREPAASYEWSVLIGDTELRHNAEWNAFRDWIRKDAAAAKLKISASDLPDPQKQDLVHMAR